MFTGTMHFVIPRTYRSIMPDYLPAHSGLVYASGLAEIAGGAGVLHPKTRRIASWWSIATLVAVFPANIHMAQHPERYRSIPGWTSDTARPASVAGGVDRVGTRGGGMNSPPADQTRALD